MKTNLRALKNYINQVLKETRYVASAPARFGLKDVEVEADNTREAGELASKRFSMQGTQVDPFTISIQPKKESPMSNKPGTSFDYALDGSYSSYKVITRETLKKIAPAAMTGPDNEDEYLDTIWVMDEKPVLESIESDGYENWSQTNEPELAEWLADVWDEVVVDLGDKKVVILCGGLDDEGGWFWNNSDQTWNTYAY